MGRCTLRAIWTLSHALPGSASVGSSASVSSRLPRKRWFTLSMPASAPFLMLSTKGRRSIWSPIHLRAAPPDFAASSSSRESLLNAPNRALWSFPRHGRWNATPALSTWRRSSLSTMASMRPCSRANSAVWKPSGRSCLMVSRMTRCPAKPMRAPGSAKIMSPSMANDAVTPPVVGSVSTEM